MKCPACKLDIPEDSNFCLKCGCELAGASSEVSVNRSIDGERRHVTIMFSDLSGYTAMSERLDPEEVKNIMRTIFSEVRQIIKKYDGYIERFIGDSVMAVFGIPKAHEDDPVRAIRAALEIHAAVENYGAQIKGRTDRRLTMHTGINTGLVVTGEVDEGTHGLTGDAINLASRLEGIAKDGEIVIGPDTYRQSKGQFTHKLMKPTSVKGKAEPVQLYKVSGIKAQTNPLSKDNERQIYSEMVGRDRELNKLKLQLAKAVDGAGSVVNVMGEAGIGKSRLLAEFRKADALKGTMLLEGKAISIGRNLPFHPIIDLLKHWAKIGDNESEVSMLRKLETSVKSVSREDADEVFPFLATLMGMKLTGHHAERVAGIQGEALERLILKNVRDFLSKASDIVPLVLVIDDLHWADSSSIELLESLFRIAESKRILFINIFRPDHSETSEKVCRILKNDPSVYYVEIVLEPLDTNYSEKLIGNMLNIEGLSNTLKKKIVKRTGGNPFFIEEVVRSFVDEGAMVKKGGSFQVTEKIDTMNIPYTVNDVLTARIDRLEEETRQLVKNASVIGRNFFRKILLEISTNIAGVDGRLNYLKDIQFIRDRKRLDEIEYLFKHALAQEAAYGSILHEKRKELHHTVARAIDQIFHERLHEFYGVLAFHYTQAEDWAQAEHYLSRAGEEALKVSASTEALEYYQQALKSYINTQGERANPEHLAKIEKNIGLSFYNKGAYLDAIPYVEKWLERHNEAIPTNIFIIVLKLMKSFFCILISLYLPIFRWRRNPSEQDLDIIEMFMRRQQMLSDVDSINFFTQTIFIAEKISKFKPNLVDKSVERFASLSVILSWSGISYGLSKKVLEFTRKRIPSDNLISIGAYQWFSSVHNYMAGSWNEEGDFDNEVLEAFLRVGETAYAAFYVLFKGHIILERGEKKKIQDLIAKIAEIADVYENDYAMLQMYELSIKFSLKYRKFAIAEEVAKKAIAFSRGVGLKVYTAFYSIQLARALIFLNELAGAEKIIEKYKDYYKKEVKEPYFLSFYALTNLYHSIGEFVNYRAQGDKLALKNTTKKCRKNAKAVNRLCRIASCDRTEGLRLVGLVWMLLGREAKAFKCLGKSIREGKKLGANLELSRSYFAFGKFLRKNGPYSKKVKKVDGDKCLQKARRMFIEMDLKWDIDKDSNTLSDNNSVLHSNIW